MVGLYGQNIKYSIKYLKIAEAQWYQGSSLLEIID